MSRYKATDYLKMIEQRRQDMFVPFDVVDAESMGTAEKSFVRCKGSYLKNLYKIIRSNKDTHYITCVNDFIRCSSPKEFEDQKVSVILKSARYDDKLFSASEVIGTKLAELLGINTPYIDYVDDEKKTIFIVDYLSRNDSLIPFNELIPNVGEITRKHSIGLWINRLKRATEKDQKLSSISNETLLKLIHDLIKAYLIRIFILKDNDLNGGNLAFIHSQDCSSVDLISFDYEFCFGNNFKVFEIDADTNSEFIERAIQDILEYPYIDLSRVLRDVIEELKVSDALSEKIKEIVNEYPVNDNLKEYWGYQIISNLNNLRTCYLHQINHSHNQNELI